MAAIIWRENVVSCLCERNNDVAELIRCFREAVNEAESRLDGPEFWEGIRTP